MNKGFSKFASFQTVEDRSKSFLRDLLGELRLKLRGNQCKQSALCVIKGSSISALLNISAF